MPVNRFLAALSWRKRQDLLSVAEQVDLPLRCRLSEEATTPEFIFLLESGFASEVIRTHTNGESEVGIVGRDGGAGFQYLLGPALAPSRCFMQAAGVGYRIPFQAFRQSFRDSEEIRARVLEYIQEQAVTSAYLAACNKLHGAEMRLARWVLTGCDRLDSDVLPSTQEFLSQMLGVRRTTVSLVANALQQRGAIKYSRGTVRILDRAALTSMSCACYHSIKQLNDRLYSDASERGAA